MMGILGLILRQPLYLPYDWSPIGSVCDLDALAIFLPRCKGTEGIIIPSTKGTSTACPQSFQERHIKVRKGTSTQRNPQVHGPIWRYQVDAYFALKCIHSHGRYYSKMKFNRKCGNLIRKSTARYGDTRLMHILHSNASTPMGDTMTMHQWTVHVTASASARPPRGSARAPRGLRELH